MQTTKLIASAALVILGTQHPSWAGLEFDQMEIAMGLAQVIAYAGPCGYKVDQSGLEKYFEKVGLSSPEGLSYVTVNVPRQAKEPPSEAGCTMARSTAKSIGVLFKNE